MEIWVFQEFSRSKLVRRNAGLFQFQAISVKFEKNIPVFVNFTLMFWQILKNLVGLWKFWPYSDQRLLPIEILLK